MFEILKNNKKLLAIPLTIAVVVFAGFGCSKNDLSQNSNTNTENNISWIEYSNSELGISFKYPKEWGTVDVFKERINNFTPGDPVEKLVDANSYTTEYDTQELRKNYNHLMLGNVQYYIGFSSPCSLAIIVTPFSNDRYLLIEHDDGFVSLNNLLVLESNITTSTIIGGKNAVVWDQYHNFPDGSHSPNRTYSVNVDNIRYDFKASPDWDSDSFFETHPWDEDYNHGHNTNTLFIDDIVKNYSDNEKISAYGKQLNLIKTLVESVEFINK